MATKRIAIKIAAIGIPIVLVVAAGYYFLALRPSDSDIQTARGQLTALATDVALVAPILESDSPPYFKDEQELEDFSTSVNSYNKTLSEITTSPVMQRGITSKAEFNNSKSTLLAYGKSISETTASIRIYYDLLGSCGYLRFQSSDPLNDTDFDNCRSALDKIQATPDSNFKSKFLMPYSEHIVGLVAITESKSAKKTSELAAARKKLETFYQDTTLDYGIPAAPSKTIQTLIETIDKQKQAFIR